MKIWNESDVDRWTPDEDERDDFEGATRSRSGLVGCCSFEARHELACLVAELGPRGGGDRLSWNELLAERVDEGAVVRDAVVEMRTCGQPGGADVADDLLLVHARADPHVGGDAREVVVLRLVTGAMANVHLDAVTAVPARMHDDPVGDGAHGRADRRAVIDREVRAHAAENRVRPRIGEARRDARELERRLEEALPQRLTREIVMSEARG